MFYSIALVRQLVEAAFDDEELRNFCFDHDEFRPVLRQFAHGQTKAARVRVLVDFAEGYGLLDKLLAWIKEVNLGIYAEFGSQLKMSTHFSLSNPQATRNRMILGAFVGILCAGGSGWVFCAIPHTSWEVVAIFFGGTIGALSGKFIRFRNVLSLGFVIGIIAGALSGGMLGLSIPYYDYYNDANFAKLRMLGVIYATLFQGVAGGIFGVIIAFSTNECLKLIEWWNK